ncbi:minor capsid protein [Magnetospirillum molischianum]|uniref:Uncharacterized protein n=1 Tax=Magnetospirillum molischianum DSM 120 TaxID=1150626 RepID=H8FY54_MAGML|nr:minor capsid protein [Magnetospirillum molischianum]CCG43292.1 conserved hypothetical protein [Magnetospirillum molischianum DSM 120]
MKIDDLADRLGEKGVGVVGVDVFTHYMPDTCEAGVLLLLGDDPIDAEIGSYRPNAKFQAVVRHSQYPAGFALADKVIDALTIMEEKTAGMFINFCRPRHEPVVFPRSTGNLLEWSINFDANYVKL